MLTTSSAGMATRFSVLWTLARTWVVNPKDAGRSPSSRTPISTSACRKTRSTRRSKELVCDNLYFQLCGKADDSMSIDLNALPGCNPIQNGPGPATMIKECNALTVTGTGTTAPTPTLDPPATTGLPPPATTTFIPPPATQVPPPTETAPNAPAQTHYGQCGG